MGRGVTVRGTIIQGELTLSKYNEFTQTLQDDFSTYIYQSLNSMSEVLVVVVKYWWSKVGGSCPGSNCPRWQYFGVILRTKLSEGNCPWAIARNCANIFHYLYCV